MNILVCDDDRAIVDAIEIYLSQEGYTILKAYDGLEAIKMLQENEVHLMLLDITMPGRSGLEVLNDILAFKRNAKVIMCSAVGQEQVIAEAIRCGASDFIIKPFKDEEILKIVKACL